MKLVINGESTEYAGPPVLEDLLAWMKVAPERVAVVVNDVIIRKTGRKTCALSEGDRIEILVFAGGG